MNSLYRKYRPQKFAEVIGQNHITSTLANQIKAGKVSHAYLFCGTRGTGKTSAAKIFAREINGGAGELDIFEIDAASNNSVADVREIIEKVKYPPVNGKYKIYIIDEIHMFSGSAFNAFLKTLEEPPKHVIFILCTTEPQKLLPTVQSRCLRFDFRLVSQANLEKHIKDVLKKEKVQISDGAIKLLAEAGAGSVRDALSFTETVMHYCSGREITETDVSTVIGTVPKEILQNLLENIIKSDTAKIIKTIDTIFARGINTNMLVKNFISIIKSEFLKNPSTYAKPFQIFSELELIIKNSTDPRSHFENTCLLACIRD